MKRRKEDADQTKEALLQAALTVFSQKGFTSSTLEDIATQAGVTRGALYHHFGGKAEMFNTLLQAAIRLPQQTVQEALLQGGSFLEILKRVFVEQIMMVQTDAIYRATVELIMFKLESNPELEAVKTLLADGRQASLLLLEQSMKDGIALGEVRTDLEPMELARMFLSLQIGLFHLWNSQGFNLEQSAKACAEVMIAGIRA